MSGLFFLGLGGTDEVGASRDLYLLQGGSLFEGVFKGQFDLRSRAVLERYGRQAQCVRPST